MLRARLHGHVGPLALEFDLDVAPGIFVLVGPNGAGKTSTLRLLLGLARPSSGLVSLGGEVLYDAERHVDLPTEERGLGYLPQGFALFPHLTAQQNVEFAVACRAPALGRGARADEARGFLRSLDVLALADRVPASLSGGEAQAVALARALASRPKALLLDEPLASLDPGTRRRVRTYLRERLGALGLPTIVVSHAPEDAEALADRCGVLERGKLVQVGTYAELKASPATPFVAAFVRGEVA